MNEESLRISPVSKAELPDVLQDTINRLQENKILGSTTSVRIWAHRPKIALAWLQLIETFYTESALDERLRELIRLRISAVTNCEACKVSRKSEKVSIRDVACISNDESNFERREINAMDFAARLAGDHETIDADIYERLKLDFSNAQIVEINMFAALMMAGGRMTYAQKAY